MTQRIETAMGDRIQQLDWMSPETKTQALVKAPRHPKQDWVSRQVARLQLTENRAPGLCRKHQQGQRF